MSVQNKHLFLTDLEAGSSISRCHYSQLLGEGPPPGSQTAASCLCLHLTKRESSVLSSPYRSTNLIMEPPYSWSNLTLVSSQKPYLQIPSHWELRFQHMNFGGCKHLIRSTDVQTQMTYNLYIICNPHIICTYMSNINAHIQSVYVYIINVYKCV